MKRQLENSSKRKIALLVSLATAVARLLVGVCPRRRRTNRQAKLADSGERPPKSSIFRCAGVLQLPLKKFIYFSVFLVGCSDAPQTPIDEEIDQYEKKALEEEVHSMEAFRSNYSKFVHELEKSEESEERVRQLERQKQTLEGNEPSSH